MEDINGYEQNQNEASAGINNSETANEDRQMQEEMRQLDEALDDLAADMQVLQARKDGMERQMQELNGEIKKNQKIYRKTKRHGVIPVLITIWLLFALLSLLRSSSVSHIWLLSGSFDSDNSLEQQKSELDIESERRQREIDQQLDQEYGIEYQELRKLEQQRDSLRKEIMSIQLSKESAVAESGQINVADTVLTAQNRKELDDYIASLDRYSDKRVERKIYNGNPYYEVVRRYDLVNYLLNDAGNATVYPGAVLRGDSLMQGTTLYTVLAQDRMPMTLTCSLGGNSIRLEDMSYGAVTQAVRQLWAESQSEDSQKWEYTVHYSRNEKGLKLSLGIEVGKAGFDFGASHTETTSTAAINFTATYFSVVAEPTGSATQFFRDGYDLKNLGSYEPAYVSSVDYGKRLVVLVTTELSEDELNAKLGANIQGANISAAIGYIQKNIDSGCRIYAYGGDSAQNLQLLDSKKQGGIKGWWDTLVNGDSDVIDDVSEVIAGDDSLKNPVPLAYHLNYLSDNSTVPAVAILSDNIILADNAKLVTLTLGGGKNSVAGVFQLDDSASSIGYVVNEDQIRIDKKGNTSGNIQFIWDSSQAASLTGDFNGKHCSYLLTAYSMEEEHTELLENISQFLSTRQTVLHIFISDAVYEIQ